MANVSYIYTKQLDSFQVPRETVLKKYGVGFIKQLGTPAAKIGARTAHVIAIELRYRSSLSCVTLGDSNKETFNWFTKVAGNLSQNPIQEIVEERGGLLGLILPKQVITTLPAPYDFRYYQLGRIIGLSGDFVQGAKEFLKFQNEAWEQNQSTIDYIDEVGFQPVGFGLKSVGGTEPLNMGSNYMLLDEIKPAYWGDVLLVCDHANAKPLIAWRIISGLRREQFVIIRDNFRRDVDLRTGDYEIARFLADLMAQYGEEGTPDVSTIINHFLEGNRVVQTRSVNVDVPVRPTLVKTGVFIKFITRKGKQLRDKRLVVQALTRRLSELCRDEPKDGYTFYLVHGPIEPEEWNDLKDNARSLTNRQIIKVDAGGLPVRKGNKLFVRFMILRIHSGSRSIPAIDKFFDLEENRPAPTFSDLVPKDILNKTIESSPRVHEGLDILAEAFGTSIKKVVRGSERYA